MAVLGSFLKQPAEIRRLSVNYEKKALAPDETITAATVSVTPADAPDPLEAMVLTFFPDKNVLLSVQGGLSGETYMVTVRADTSDGQRLESEIVVSVEEIAL